MGKVSRGQSSDGLKFKSKELRYNLIGSEEPQHGLLMRSEPEGGEPHSWCRMDQNGQRMRESGQLRAFCERPGEAPAW